ncbi:3541_t:CDS:2 [Acaulospora morrowiae]|uniref:3541_t:CDS:1 n=1 Tax=Acaulospora morrowiae TaxID=94023 RepID=A0A9N9FWJ2_9GLOM|nr:3541_t:CDS:2 [Acaulospora morrowiae]
MTVNFFTTLSSDFSKLLDITDFRDSIIQVGDHNNTKSFEAHSIILFGRCDYFRAALSHGWTKKVDDKFHFNLVDLNITHDAFGVILKYMYSGTFFLEHDNDLNMLLQLLIATDILLLKELFDFIEEQIINHKSMWIKSDFNSILQMMLQVPAASKLNLCCQEIIADQPSLFFESPEFLHTEEDVLIHVLESEALGMEEIRIWERVIDWGISNTPSLNQTSVSNFSTKQFKALQSTLENILPLIRFFSISPKDLEQKVGPFRQILPRKDLMDQIHFYYDISNFRPSTCVILPPHSPSLDSTLINREMAGLIATWIDKRDLLPDDGECGGDVNKEPYNGINMPYNFKLLYRHRPHGPPPSIIHHNGATIIVMRMKYTGGLIGGYNPVDWSSYRNSSSRKDGGIEYFDTEESFLFSFTSNDKCETKVLVEDRSTQQATNQNQIPPPIRATIQYYASDGSFLPATNTVTQSSNSYRRDNNNTKYNATLSRVKKGCSESAVGFGCRGPIFGQTDLCIHHRPGRRYAGTIGLDGKWYGRPKDPDRLTVTLEQKTYEKSILGKSCCDHEKMDIEISEMEVFQIVRKSQY